jgi:hypothetical protein
VPDIGTTTETTSLKKFAVSLFIKTESMTEQLTAPTCNFPTIVRRLSTKIFPGKGKTSVYFETPEMEEKNGLSNFFGILTS